MRPSRVLIGAAVRAAGRGLVDASRGDERALGRRFRVDEDWRRIEDGRAVRLGPDTTISVTPVGRWRRVDPLVPSEGWRRPWKAVGLLAWAATVGGAWWLGASRGRGPLASLHDRESRPW